MTRKRRLLVTGAAGFLGWNICSEATAAWQVTGTVHRRTPQPPRHVIFTSIDLTAQKAVESLLERCRPDAVIHCAAMASPNTCEQQPQLSRRINVDATRELAEACAQRGIRFAFTSTDLVFDGEHAPYDEQASPSPLSEYGRQKLEAEQQILECHPQAIICRMPLMYGSGSPVSRNCLMDFLNRARTGEAIPLFTDEYRTPLDGVSAARGCLLALENACGVLHLGGPERLSRFELGMMMAEAFGVNAEMLQKTQQKDVQMPAPRPADVSLVSSRATKLGFKPDTPIRALRRLATLNAN